ncbi:MAG: hypothetical protein M1497_03485 [Nitrospirae bacterium]|nr:hypothetical protein [Nitrospirota bacterium]
MKMSASRTFLLVLMTVSFVMISRASMAGTGGKDFEEIKVSIEKAPLSQEEKAGLLKRASDAVNAGLPSADVAVIVKRGLARGMESKTIEEFIAIPASARERNLPVRPVLDRVQQGLSKGVPPEKISAFSRRLVEKLAMAEKIVYRIEKSGIKADKRSYREEGTQTVARALERAIPEDTITKMGLKAARKRASFTTFNASINTMATFVEMGMPLERASKLIDKAIDKGYSEKEMLIMERGMAHEMKDGMKMEDIVNGMDSMMNNGTMGSWSKGMGGGPMQGSGFGMGSGSTFHTMPGMGTHHGAGGGGMGTPCR